MVVDLVVGELDRVHERIAGRFGRAEPRARVREYVSGLVAGLERNNGWTAEHAGEVSQGLSNNGPASGDSELKIAIATDCAFGQGPYVTPAYDERPCCRPLALDTPREFEGKQLEPEHQEFGILGTWCRVSTIRQPSRQRTSR